MNLAQISIWRNFLGKVGAACCFLVFFALLDGLVARFREPANVFRMLPGESAEINGPLEAAIKDVSELRFEANSPQLKVSFEAGHKGYFLGGDMWRGRLIVSPQIPPGEYTLSVSIKGKTSPRPPPPYRIMVYPDTLTRLQSSKSLIQRYAGHSPWEVPVLLLPVILLTFASVFFLSQKTERLLEQMGQAEVYRVAKREGDYLVSFGLGTAHGVHLGSRLALFDESGQLVGTVEVEETSETDSSARVSTDREIRPGYIVCLDR
ncbi:MAG: hypothetical protein Q8M54_00680 [Desulfobaccales bacterium]|nr:hypothetical protein [Desulfobaccales bacterium]